MKRLRLRDIRWLVHSHRLKVAASGLHPSYGTLNHTLASRSQWACSSVHLSGHPPQAWRPQDLCLVAVYLIESSRMLPPHLLTPLQQWRIRALKPATQNPLFLQNWSFRSVHEDTETDSSNRVSLGSIINKCPEKGQGKRFAAVLLGIWGVKHKQFKYIFYFHSLPLSRTSIFHNARWIRVVFF